MFIKQLLTNKITTIRKTKKSSFPSRKERKPSKLNEELINPFNMMVERQIGRINFSQAISTLFKIMKTSIFHYFYIWKKETHGVIIGPSKHTDHICFGKTKISSGDAAKHE